MSTRENIRLIARAPLDGSNVFFPKFNRPLDPGFIIPDIKNICDRLYRGRNY